MVPPLDLSQSKMMVSPPRLNLRRTASYQHEKGPLSATSSRFSSFNHLLSSPPPSPGLPALVPRSRKSSNTPRPSKVFRLVAWIAGIIVVCYVVAISLSSHVQVPLGWVLERDGEYEMVGQDDVPEFPTPITVTDGYGRSKWTVSIPPTARFPLSMDEYSDMCGMCREVASHVRELHGRGPPSQQAQPGYYDEDPYFVDVSEAERRGLLPSSEGKAWKVTARAQADNLLLGEDRTGLIDQETCRTSLTYVLESSDAGLGNTLIKLWMAYGLAKKERRAFFIDDSRWAYGRYTDIFQAPPSAGCRAPPRHEMLPCPRQARHLVVSSATAHEIFGRSFSAQYERPRRADASRERPVFDLARAGYEDLFHLNDHDQAYVLTRIKELREKAAGGADEATAAGTLVGVHVRHGDLHPYEYQYNGAYIPLNIYAERAREILESGDDSNSDTDADANSANKQNSFVVVASDDPLVYESEEFTGALRAQELIKLASKQSSDTAGKRPDPRMMHKFVDESFGWEGGFFASMFWNLGRPSQNNAVPEPEKKHQQAQGPADPSEVATRVEPSAEAMRLRGLIGRAYAMDLAVLGQATDAVVCTLSAMACRLVAVIMGWEAAVDQARWVNIDGDYSWTAGLSVQ